MRTEYRYIVQRDSVRVERWDTVRVEVRGDTIRIFERLHEREYYSTIYRDTLRRCDTLMIMKEQTEKSKKRANGAKWYLIGLASGVFLLILTIILIKLLKK